MSSLDQFASPRSDKSLITPWRYANYRPLTKDRYGFSIAHCIWQVFVTDLSQFLTCSFIEKDRVSGYWTFMFVMSKVPELGDTIFIVLRKQPLIFLHWWVDFLPAPLTFLLFTWHSSMQVPPHYSAVVQLVLLLGVHRGGKVVHHHELLGPQRHVHLLCIQGNEVIKPNRKWTLIAR